MSNERDQAPEPRPSNQFAFDSSYDFAFRPETYWPDLPTEETVLAKVKGTVRRDVARALLEEPDETAPDGIGDFLLRPDLGKKGKDFWGSFHPANLGGEFLPGYGDDEVEIARIELASVTGDVIQVRARRGDGGRIHYRVVDEYWDQGTSYSVSQEASDEPLALGELIELIDTSDHDDDVYDGGLVDSHHAFHLSECGDRDPAEFADFATVSSHFYPMLDAYYSERADAWLLEVEAEREAEREEELHEWLWDYRWQLEELTKALRGSKDSDELPEDPRARAEVLLGQGLLRRAEANCDEIGASADDLRVMIAIKDGDTAEALRLAKRIAWGVSSPFYPMLDAYNSERADAWLLEVEAEREAEREEELDKWLWNYQWQLEELTEALKGSKDSDELPEDPRARAEVLLVEGLLRRAEANCDEIGESADDLRVMIAIKGGDMAEALRLAKRIAGSG